MNGFCKSHVKFQTLYKREIKTCLNSVIQTSFYMTKLVNISYKILSTYFVYELSISEFSR